MNGLGWSRPKIGPGELPPSHGIPPGHSRKMVFSARRTVCECGAEFSFRWQYVDHLDAVRELEQKEGIPL